MHPYDPAEPKEQTFTKWHNPTDREVVLDLYVGPTAGPSGRVRYRAAPGGDCIIPSEFDRGVQDVREGVIVGGLGPTLKRVGGSDVLHSSLDPANIAKASSGIAPDVALVAALAAEAAVNAAKAQAAAAKQSDKQR
jgi:hypothetical protein